MGEDTFLLADVGGTNTRLALGTRCGLLPQTLMRYRNDDYPAFSDVLHSYQAQHTNQRIQSAAIAVAGQVVEDKARLTNRDWTFEADHLAGEIGCTQVQFVNDMGGLARAIPVLSLDQKSELQNVAALRPNDQSLVLGLGTGVNASALLGETALAAEIGHTGLSVRMAQIIEAALGSTQKGFDTVEDVLSGRGLERLHAIATGNHISARDICQTAAQSAEARKTCLLYGTVLAELIRELVLHYLPRNGLYLSGSVARGVMDTPAKQQIINSLASDHPMRATLEGMPVSLITDDAAALLGCLEIAKSAA
jgi:glucokinase